MAIKGKKIKGSEALLFSLLEERADTIFGYPGGQIIPVYDALYIHSDKIRHILTRHEQGAVHAAQGFARATGRVGVCFATSGPGATNLITGIADAMMDSTPIVCVTGQVPSTLLGSDAFQEADVISMTTPITKWSYQVTRASEIPEAIAKAFYVASSGRPGPVVIDITKDAQVEEIEWNHYTPCSGFRSYTTRPVISKSNVKQAADLINTAKKPMILFGQGIKLSNAERALISFAEKGDIPMASTLMGLSGIPTDHKLYKGMLGMHGNYAPNILSQESDLLIAVGMRFSDRITGNIKKYAPNSKLIHIDIDPVEIDKIIRADVGINGDALEVLEQLTPMVEKHDHSEWLKEFDEKYKKEYDSVIKECIYPERDSLNMAEVVRMVSERGNSESIIVTDVGQQQMIAARYSTFKSSRSLITSGGLGTMGYGLPAAIGAKVGAPKRNVVLFVGDGGFQMTMQELGTIMHWNIGVKVVILNNNFLGMVRQWQELFFGQRYSSTDIPNPDFIKIGEAYGIKSRHVTTREELSHAIEELYADDKAFLMEVKVEREDNVFPMVPPGAAISEIILNKENS